MRYSGRWGVARLRMAPRGWLGYSARWGVARMWVAARGRVAWLGGWGVARVRCVAELRGAAWWCLLSGLCGADRARWGWLLDAAGRCWWLLALGWGEAGALAEPVRDVFVGSGEEVEFVREADGGWDSAPGGLHIRLELGAEAARRVEEV